MPKRLRESYSSQGSNRTTASALRASTVVVDGTRMRSERKVTRSKSFGGMKMRVPRGLSRNYLTQELSQKLKVKITTYGNDAFRFGPADAVNAATPFTEFGPPEGGSPKLVARAGSQGWSEFLVMPLFDSRCDPCAMDICRLLDKCVTDLGATHFSHNGGSGLVADGKSMNLLLRQPYEGIEQFFKNMYYDLSSPNYSDNLRWIYDAKFCYYGGFQEHTFQNYTEHQVTLELSEFTPRVPMKQIGPSPHMNSAGLQYNTREEYIPIASYIRVDNLMAKPQYNQFANAANLVVDNTIDDDPFDYEFDTEGYMPYTKTHYRWTKPTCKVLDPGDKYIHKIYIPPFTLNMGRFITLALMQRGRQDGGIAGILSSTTALFQVLYDSYPAFTRTLVARYWGEMGKAENGDGEVFLGKTDCVLTHTQTEYHECRFLPIARKSCYFKINRLNAAGEMDGAMIVNAETNELQEQDDPVNENGGTLNGDDNWGVGNMIRFSNGGVMDDNLENNNTNYQP